MPNGSGRPLSENTEIKHMGAACKLMMLLCIPWFTTVLIMALVILPEPFPSFIQNKGIVLLICLQI